jgi:uncharacterized protein YndB with AHSA1/START domain
MELKTKTLAEDGRQDLFITREFDLPVELVFKAHVEPELISQWMGTDVLKFEGKKHGSFHFKTTDSKGNPHHFLGTIHDFIPDQKIVRTFEFENMGLGVQLEVLQFEKISEDTSKLNIHVIFESEAHRAKQLQMPFAQGINYAHARLEAIVKPLNH